jgi:hypothetical protein
VGPTTKATVGHGDTVMQMKTRKRNNNMLVIIKKARCEKKSRENEACAHVIHSDIPAPTSKFRACFLVTQTPFSKSTETFMSSMLKG